MRIRNEGNRETFRKKGKESGKATEREKETQEKERDKQRVGTGKNKQAEENNLVTPCLL